MNGQLTVLASFTLVAFLATVVPGPDTAVVVKHSLRGSRRPAIAAAAGCSLGQLGWGGASVVGIGALLAHSVIAFTIVKYVGAAYLLVLGIRTLRQSRHQQATAHAEAPPKHRNAFRDGLLVNALNPKTALFMSALLPQFISPGAPGWLPFVLVGLTAVVSFSWMSLYAVVFTRLAGALRRPSVRRAMDRVIGTVLVGLGIRLAIDHA